MITFCDMCFKCNEVASLECVGCPVQEECGDFVYCFGHIPSVMWGAMASFRDIERCIEKWREFQNGQTAK